MSPWKVQYSICNYYGDKDIVLYVSSHREKMEAVSIATARRAPNKSTNNAVDKTFPGVPFNAEPWIIQSCPLKFSQTCLGVSVGVEAPSVWLKTLCFFHTCVSRLTCLNVPKCRLLGSRQPQNFICEISLQGMLTPAKTHNKTILSHGACFIYLPP